MSILSYNMTHSQPFNIASRQQFYDAPTLKLTQLLQVKHQNHIFEPHMFALYFIIEWSL